MKKLKNWRIFWTASMNSAEDNYYYWIWKNWLTNQTVSIFAGYNRKALIRKRFSYITLKARLNLG
jgi:hypothetical protein